MDLEKLVNEHYDNLNHNDFHIWEYIRANKDTCYKLTIDKLADKCNVSRSTILRFAKKLSLNGYSELKIYLKWQADNKIKYKENDIDKIFDNYYKAINEFKEKDFTKCCKMIYEAKRVFVYGTGTVQNAAAKELKRIFLSGQECIYVLEGELETELFINKMTSEDVIILISLTGESKSIKKLAKKIVLKNIPIISITKLKNNELARLSSEKIYITTFDINMPDIVSWEATNMFFILVEILFIRYLEYKTNRIKSDIK